MDEWIEMFLKNLEKVDNFFNKKLDDIEKEFDKLQDNLERKNKEYFTKEESLDNTLPFQSISLKTEAIDNNQKLSFLEQTEDERKGSKHLQIFERERKGSKHLHIEGERKGSKQLHSENLRFSILTSKASIKDELGYSGSWKRATSNLYVQLIWLKGFSNINEIASRILNKKIKNIYGNGTKTELIKALNIKLEDQNFFKNQIQLENLKETLKIFYADNFNKGDIKKAEKDFDERLNGASKVHDSFTLYFCIGVLLTLAIYVPMVSFINSGK